MNVLIAKVCADLEWAKWKILGDDPVHPAFTWAVSCDRDRDAIGPHCVNIALAVQNVEINSGANMSDIIKKSNAAWENLSTWWDKHFSQTKPVGQRILSLVDLHKFKQRVNYFCCDFM